MLYVSNLLQELQIKDCNLVVNGMIKNDQKVELILKEKSLTLWPKIKAGTLNIQFWNVHGMPTKKQNRHKMKDFQELLKEDIIVLQETACGEGDKPWICQDDMRVVCNNPVQQNNNHPITSGAGTIIYCKETVQMNPA